MSTIKFQVNREKMRDGNMARDQASQHWETIRDAILKIQNKQASSLSYEELYRTAYNLVLHKHGEMLYTNVKNTTAELLKPIAEASIKKTDEEFLCALNKLWADQKMCIIMIKDILLYMNKNYVPKLKLKPVEQMQYSQFKHNIVLHPLIKTRLVSRLVEEIRKDRDGEIIDKGAIRQAIHMLLEVGVHSRKIYEQEFESVLLAETAAYYRLESNQLILENSCAAYLSKASQRLKQEYERVASYLSPSTETALIQVFLDEYIGEQHASNLLGMDSSGLVSMIRNNKIPDITLLYTIFSRRPKSFELLKRSLSEYIVLEGFKLVQDEKLRIEEFVVKLIQLRESIIEIYVQAMARDPHIDLTIKMAFEKVCNEENKTAKALVSYLDEMFKTEFKTIQESDMMERIDKVVQIFRYLENKDVFEGHYKNSFGKRLLEQRNINEDAERALLLKLKEECGLMYTQKLEVMFKDIKISEELSKDFQNSNMFKTMPAGLEINVKVLSTGHWPFDQKEPIQNHASMPREMVASMSCFAQFYFNKFNNGKQLNWKFSLGTADLRSKLNSQTRYEFQVSTYQMFILLLFNQNQEITYQQICQLTQIPVQDLSLHLIPLIKNKVLLKSPADQKFNQDDKLSVNYAYTSQLLRNRIPVMISNKERQQESFRVAGKVEDDRRYTVEANIIKVMKARKTIEISQLMLEVTKLLSLKFKPDNQQIKQRIDVLIDRGYIERDEADKRIFKYIA